MWQMFLVVFVRRNLMKHIKQVQKGSIPLGVLSMIGDKGAVMIQMTLLDKVWSFVSCHLASGPDLGSKRSEMFATALSALSRQLGSEFDMDGVSDFNFILGDLNYRFKTTYQRHIKRVEESKNMLYDLDELTYETMINKKYRKYFEMPINFDPTYKRDFE
jgi:hypothetical protein